MTVVIESDTWLLVCINCAIWLVLSSTCHFLTDNSLQSAHKDQQEMLAVAEKPHDAVVKFEYVSKFTAASHGPPCDRTESCFGGIPAAPHRPCWGHREQGP